MESQKYRTKLVEIEAWQLTKENVVEVARWCGAQIVSAGNYIGLNISTLDGVIRGDEGDFIIRDFKGNFHPCKPDIFRAKYEKV